MGHSEDSSLWSRIMRTDMAVRLLCGAKRLSGDAWHPFLLRRGTAVSAGALAMVLCGGVDQALGGSGSSSTSGSFQSVEVKPRAASFPAAADGFNVGSADGTDGLLDGQGFCEAVISWKKRESATRVVSPPISIGDFGDGCRGIFFFTTEGLAVSTFLCCDEAATSLRSLPAEGVGSLDGGKLFTGASAVDFEPALNFG